MFENLKQLRKNDYLMPMLFMIVSIVFNTLSEASWILKVSCYAIQAVAIVMLVYFNQKTTVDASFEPTNHRKYRVLLFCIILAMLVLFVVDYNWLD